MVARTVTENVARFDRGGKATAFRYRQRELPDGGSAVAVRKRQLSLPQSKTPERRPRLGHTERESDDEVENAEDERHEHEFVDAREQS